MIKNVLYTTFTLNMLCICWKMSGICWTFFKKIVIVLKIKQKLIVVEYFRILKIELECIRSFSNDLFIEQICQTLYNYVSQLKKILKDF